MDGMARFCPLFSGSQGNCTYIGGAQGGILIDAGVSAKGIAQALQGIGVQAQEIKGIFVTHEHSDHVAGLRVFASRNHIPVYASEGTAVALERAGKIDARVNLNLMNGAATEAAGMAVTSFPTDHDCADSRGYIICTPDGRRIAVCTDLGHISEAVRDAITGCDLVMLESNHDVMMLQNGPYPYPLKRRILSDCGHLSNACCADELPRLVGAGATRLVLAHLSRENNYPALALACAKASLDLAGVREGIDCLLEAAPQSGGKLMVL